MWSLQELEKAFAVLTCIRKPQMNKACFKSVHFQSRSMWLDLSLSFMCTHTPMRTHAHTLPSSSIPLRNLIFIIPLTQTRTTHTMWVEDLGKEHGDNIILKDLNEFIYHCDLLPLSYLSSANMLDFFLSITPGAWEREFLPRLMSISWHENTITQILNIT